MYIGEGVTYVHAVFLPPGHRFGALLGTPPLQKWAKRVIFGAKILSSIKIRGNYLNCSNILWVSVSFKKKVGKNRGKKCIFEFFFAKYAILPYFTLFYPSLPYFSIPATNSGIKG